ncbi:putative mitochondrial outer membrane protein porin 5 [Iris pallida]|uniref:Mitochondrial outer membrane protein porin 5 n=1 Tax=Iris pallida TaxID=29817 RepID=A0AAX6EW49_IRIPA|nr:putative mitochondrial outer membrane protein porin 5 [Iris pallida]
MPLIPLKRRTTLNQRDQIKLYTSFYPHYVLFISELSNLLGLRLHSCAQGCLMSSLLSQDSPFCINCMVINIYYGLD